MNCMVAIFMSIVVLPMQFGQFSQMKFIQFVSHRFPLLISTLPYSMILYYTTSMLKFSVKWGLEHEYM